MTGVPFFLFAFLVSSWEMDGKAERRWPGTSPCDNEKTIALRKNALQAYEGKSSELIPPGSRSRVGTHPLCAGHREQLLCGKGVEPPRGRGRAS